MLPWLIICFAVAMIGVAKSGFGGGLGLMVVPITALALGAVPGYKSEDALGLLLPLLIVGDFIAIAQYYKLPNWSLVRRLLPGAFVGIVLGTLLIWLFKQQKEIAAALIQIEIGLESLFLVALTWWRQYRGAQHKLLPEPARAIATSIFAGVSTTLAHAAGPIIAMYLLPLNLGRQVMVATSATFFAIANITKLPTYWQAGLFDKVSPTFSLLFFPLVLGGAIFGRWLCRRMSDRVFSQIILATVFILGWYLLAIGTIALIRHTL
ncbi:MAG TPA: sulfite exporter TauE/SafE family protein [Tepidisphaeraceae bacterium]|jgi:hypothetical protein